jgi:hypothetical protein
MVARLGYRDARRPVTRRNRSCHSRRHRAAPPQSWQFWGTGVSIIFLFLGMLIGPVYIAPLFNTYKPLQSPTIKNQILSLAHANGISARSSRSCCGC